MLRRILLGVITALVVARPLVLGEDPGLLDSLSGTSNLLLTLLWLFVAVGWAAWRVWSGQGGRLGGLVEAGLLALVGAVFLSANFAAKYQHPAWLITWEWLALLGLFLVVRQLVRTPAENHGLLAALLATGVSVAAYGIYQAIDELPRMRADYGANLEKLRAELAKENQHFEENDPHLGYLARRIADQHAFGTYAHPNSFAGFLSLLLPVALGLTASCWLRWRAAWPTIVVGGLAAVLALALWFTHSQGAMLATFLVVGIGLLLSVSRWGDAGSSFLKNRVWIVAGLVVAVVVLGLLVRGGMSRSATGKDSGRSVEVRLAYWSATWKMIGDHGLLGVGPGNYGRYYPRYMSAVEWEKIQDPHNFVLEVWATCGIVGLAALLATLAAFYWRLGRAWKELDFEPPPPRSPPPETASESPTPWEFYLGGIGGLLLGFVVRAMGQTPDGVLVEGAMAAVRSLIWLVVFALVYALPWSGRGKILALAGGVTALLLNLLVSGGINFPSVAQPLWVMMALTLNALPAQTAIAEPDSRFGAWLPLPLSAGLCATFWIFVFNPVSESAAAVKQARQAQLPFAQAKQQLMVLRAWTAVQVVTGAPPAWLPENCSWAPIAFLGTSYQTVAQGNAEKALVKPILEPLVDAARVDKANILPRIELAQWYGELWQVSPLMRSPSQLKGASFAAVEQAAFAQKLDPEGKDGYFAEYRLRLLFADRRPTDRPQQLDLAAKALRRVIELDPTEARYHFQLADILVQLKSAKEARSEAELAWKFDQLSTEAGRKLSDPQREQVRLWRDGSSGG